MNELILGQPGKCRETCNSGGFESTDAGRPNPRCLRTLEALQYAAQWGAELEMLQDAE